MARTKVAPYQLSLNFDDVDDVDITDVTDNELLVYDNSSSAWINKTVAEAGIAASGHNHDSDYAPAELSISTKTADYTLALADANTLIEMNKSSAQTLTIPTNSSVAFAVGTQILIYQKSSSQLTVSGASGVTVNKHSDFNAKTTGQYSTVGLVKIATDTWLLFGDLEQA